jgi:GR25 family glycosyltransferase involved in LPS biosynthesis
MSKWVSFYDCIYLLNLPERTDKLIASVEQFEKYDIPFKRVSAIKMENGAEGLRETLIQVLTEAIDQKYKNILIFEDDFDIVDESFNDIMDKATEQLPEDYRIMYLGCQPTRGFQNFHSPNLLCLQGAFATHAWGLSARAMNDILNYQVRAPIDNFIVDKIQPLGGIYCTYPMLATQRPGMSDIGRTFIDWRPFMDMRFNQKLYELNSRS